MENFVVSLLSLFQFFSFVRIIIISITSIILIQGILEIPIPYLPLWLNLSLAISVIHIITEYFRYIFIKNTQIITTVYLVLFWLLFVTFSNFKIFMIDNTYNLQIVSNSFTLVILIIYLFQNLRRSVEIFAKIKISSRLLITLSFLIVIVIGTILLMLPISINDHNTSISLINAFFTAVSAVCVTGLIVVDTATYFSRFGQIVILGLIQIGGLGLVTITTVFISLLGRNLSLTGHLSAKDSISQTIDRSLTNYLGFILGFTIVIELVIAVLLYIRFIDFLPFQTALFYSIFHAISAFCNAGFALFSDSFIGFNNDILINISIMCAVIIGGLGFGVWLELQSHYIEKNSKKLTLQTLITISVSTGLTILGTLLFYFFEKDQSLQYFTMGNQFLSSLFASVNLRTSGFNNIDLTYISEPTRLVSIFLMYIGASPGSTGGGIKTTSFLVLWASVHAGIRKGNIMLFGRHIDESLVMQTWILVFNSITWILLVTLLICYFDKLSLSEALYETVSAFGTVGSSVGATPKLGTISKVLISITMILGRIGPTTIMLALLGRNANKASLIRRPTENISIG